MDNQNITPSHIPSNNNYNYASSEIKQALTSLNRILDSSTDIINTLRREFRGEVHFEDKEGNEYWIQNYRPYFVKLDPKTKKPEMVEVELPTKQKRLCYIPNDEAIEEVLSMLKAMGLNQLTLITNLDEGTILDDLKEFECKLAAVLAQKQPSWGIDKAMLPMIQSKIKTLVQDARYMAKNGKTLSIIQTSIQRVEQVSEQQGKNNFFKSPYN